MKRLLYLLPLVFAFATGCIPKSNTPPSNTIPQGTFTGQFKLTHTSSKTGLKDSLTANIQLQIEPATGYTVTGDTATVHAGSFGSYGVNQSNYTMLFVDKTFPPTGTPKKIHLAGVYDYIFNGTNLQLVAYGALDTLTYYYNLKYTGN